MLSDLLAPLSAEHQIFNLFNYITFRTGGAILTALLISLILGAPFINWLKQRQSEGQPIRDDGPETHFVKKGTPTMGGLLILCSLVISSLLWVPLRNPYLWPVLTIIITFGSIGLVDDWMKLNRNTSKGLSGKRKLIIQLIICIFVSMVFIELSPDELRYSVALPFFKEQILPLGLFDILFSSFVIIGASHSVNLTDGLDGLAIVPVMIVAMSFAFIAYVSGNIVFSNYLLIQYISGTGELAVFCGSLIGAALGFLWFNAPPAKVFMGDTGSLALGGSLGSIAIICKHEILLSIIGGLFVLETLSVVIQVFIFKMTGKRVFLMAPLHHHFEKKGWAESTIVIRFWIITIVLALIGLATLRIR